MDTTFPSPDIDIFYSFRIVDFRFDILYLVPGNSVRYFYLKLCVLCTTRESVRNINIWLLLTFSWPFLYVCDISTQYHVLVSTRGLRTSFTFPASLQISRYPSELTNRAGILSCPFPWVMKWIMLAFFLRLGKELREVFIIYM